MTGFASADGTYTNTEGRLLAVNPATAFSLPYAGWEICREIAAISGDDSAWESEVAVSLEMNDMMKKVTYVGGSKGGTGKSLLSIVTL